MINRSSGSSGEMHDSWLFCAQQKRMATISHNPGEKPVQPILPRQERHEGSQPDCNMPRVRTAFTKFF